MVNPACRYIPEDATHFDDTNSATTGIAEVSRGMTIEYYLPKGFMIPGGSRCSIVTRSES